MRRKSYFKFISAVVVLAFTATSIIQHPSYAQDLLSPQSRFSSIADESQDREAFLIASGDNWPLTILPFLFGFGMTALVPSVAHAATNMALAAGNSGSYADSFRVFGSLMLIIISSGLFVAHVIKKMGPPSSGDSGVSSAGPSLRSFLPFVFILVTLIVGCTPQTPQQQQAAKIKELQEQFANPASSAQISSRSSGNKGPFSNPLEEDERRRQVIAVCIFAALDLSRVRNPDAVPALIDVLLHDKSTPIDPRERILTFRLLSSSEDAGGYELELRRNGEVIRSEFTSERIFCPRRSAAQALGNIADKSAIQALCTAAFLDPEKCVREASKKALGNIAGGKEALRGAIEERLATINKLKEAIKSGEAISKDSVDQIIQFACSDEEEIAREADSAFYAFVEVQPITPKLLTDLKILFNADSLRNNPGNVTKSRLGIYGFNIVLKRMADNAVNNTEDFQLITGNIVGDLMSLLFIDESETQETILECLYIIVSFRPEHIISGRIWIERIESLAGSLQIEQTRREPSHPRARSHAVEQKAERVLQKIKEKIRESQEKARAQQLQTENMLTKEEVIEIVRRMNTETVEIRVLAYSTFIRYPQQFLTLRIIEELMLLFESETVMTRKLALSCLKSVIAKKGSDIVSQELLGKLKHLSETDSSDLVRGMAKALLREEESGRWISQDRLLEEEVIEIVRHLSSNDYEVRISASATFQQLGLTEFIATYAVLNEFEILFRSNDPEVRQFSTATLADAILRNPNLSTKKMFEVFEPLLGDTIDAVRENAARGILIALRVEGASSIFVIDNNDPANSPILRAARALRRIVADSAISSLTRDAAEVQLVDLIKLIQSLPIVRPYLEEGQSPQQEQPKEGGEQGRLPRIRTLEVDGKAIGAFIDLPDGTKIDLRLEGLIAARRSP